MRALRGEGGVEAQRDGQQGGMVHGRRGGSAGRGLRGLPGVGSNGNASADPQRFPSRYRARRD
jgi:hypothetical protein